MGGQWTSSYNVCSAKVWVCFLGVPKCDSDSYKEGILGAWGDGSVDKVLAMKV